MSEITLIDFIYEFYNYCCLRDSNNCIKLLEQTKYEYINVRLKNKETPIISALWHGLNDVAQLLYDHKCDLTLVDKYGFDVLMCACTGNYNFVKMLLENYKYIDINAKNLDGRTGLYYALSRDKPDIAILLVAYDVNTDLNWNEIKDIDRYDYFKKIVHKNYRDRIVDEIDNPLSVIHRSFQTTYAIQLIDIICGFII
ncbi:MAG: hypothetical protein Faunusvirus6_28 [Faunusvirus sp.]|jgi:ankyrin repeat protein|uniref:Uncharacterized protein n=1 Tax=Faunusvirus sp. TaxID=2487766 RepID=A0A3G4ZWM8_9VIRU|nr:MAG: hypothetical protein Faunusvirus6_28 [Faunusvirus sp.]